MSNSSTQLATTQQVTPESLPQLAYDGKPVVTTAALASLYGTEEVRIRQNYTKNKARFEQGKHYYKVEGEELSRLRVALSDSQIPAKARSVIFYTERGAARHAKMLETDAAWDVFEKLEDSYFKRQEDQPSFTNAVAMPELIQAADVMASALRLEGSARLMALRSFSAANCPQLLPMMPDYAIDAPLIAGGAVSSLPTESATALLGKRDAGMGAAKFNRLCEAAGILEKKSRKKKTGGMKSFWCVTEKGLDYGKNVTSEHSPLETQPHWYCDHFDALLALVEQEKAA